MFITQNAFLKLFKDEPVTFNEFLNKAQVKSKVRSIPILEYSQQKNIKPQKFKKLYDHYVEKDKYLSNFYNFSLRIPENLSIEHEPMKTKMNNNQEMKYKNVIRNMHYKDILKNTKSGFNNASYLTVLEEFFNKLILDYNLVIPSTLKYIENDQIGSVYSSIYFRASIMNPYLVFSLNKTILHGTKIFTPTLGWSSYCYGFLECDEVTEYVGTDVIPSVCKKTQQFAEKYYPNKTTQILCQPSESLFNSSFDTKYKKYFDTVFFSPPYYKLELYKSNNQSTDEYDTYEKWLSNYWENTIKLINKILSKNGTLCYILSGYGKDLDFDLANDMNNITKKYFKLKQTIQMYNQSSNKKHRTTNEEIFIFTR